MVPRAGVEPRYNLLILNKINNKDSNLTQNRAQLCLFYHMRMNANRYAHARIDEHI